MKRQTCDNTFTDDGCDGSGIALPFKWKGRRLCGHCFRADYEANR